MAFKSAAFMVAVTVLLWAVLAAGAAVTELVGKGPAIAAGAMAGGTDFDWQPTPSQHSAVDWTQIDEDEAHKIVQKTQPCGDDKKANEWIYSSAKELKIDSAHLKGREREMKDLEGRQKSLLSNQIEEQKSYEKHKNKFEHGHHFMRHHHEKKMRKCEARLEEIASNLEKSATEVMNLRMTLDGCRTQVAWDTEDHELALVCEMPKHSAVHSICQN